MRPLIDRPRHDVPAVALTTIQWRIATLVAAGLTNQAVADRLGLTSRQRIALWALEQGRRPHVRSVAAGSS